MLITPHTIVGVAIGTTIPNPFIAVPLSTGMHFLGDMVPHWDFYSHTTKEERIKGWRPIAVMFDLAIGVAVGLTATLYALWVLHDASMALNIFLCGIAAVLPDTIEAPYIFMENPPTITRAVLCVQRRMQFQAPLPWGIFTQLIVIFVSLILILSSIGL